MSPPLPLVSKKKQIVDPPPPLTRLLLMQYLNKPKCYQLLNLFHTKYYRNIIFPYNKYMESKIHNFSGYVL